ncbi:GntR family transcriptional regulator [Streptomyces sp. NPDC001404]|uniref:GntR family transcriptional regulator n=1 Tax=Streptomyces sp. NPDC001404 TaxID=3364571 RepID=UPI00369D0692
MHAPHKRLAAELRLRITDGTYPPGSIFPSVRNIAAQQSVGLGTAYRAVEILRAEGLLVGEPRRRLTVAHPVAVRTLSDPDADWPHSRGDSELASVRATSDLAVRLQVPLRALLHRERVELLDPDGRPAMVMTTWRRGAARAHASVRYQVRIHAMTRPEASLLGLPLGTPALLIERTRYGVQGSPVEVADLVLPADRWRLGF